MNMVFSVAGVSLILGIFTMLVPIALLVVLQVWLCRKSLKLGLILPILSFLMALLMVFSLTAFQTMTVGGGSVMVTEEGGTYVEVPAQEVGAEQEEHQVSVTPGEVVALAGLFLVCNIPTVVFGGIWLHYKSRQDFRDDLKKMKIEDLE